MKMKNSASQHDSVHADGQDKPLREELRREHQLVRSTGVISKPVMAMAFGVVFLLVAVLAVAQFGQWLWASALGAIGAASVAWAVYAWMRGSRRATK